MRQSKQTSGERIVKDIKRKTRKQYSAEEKIRIVLVGSEAKKALQSWAASKASHRVYITSGRRISWRLAKSGSPEISPAKPTPLKSKDYGPRRVS